VYTVNDAALNLGKIHRLEHLVMDCLLNKVDTSFNWCCQVTKSQRMLPQEWPRSRPLLDCKPLTKSR